MKMTWWGTTFTCGKCNTETTLQLVLFSADGQLRFTYWCPKCKELYNWDIFASQLAHQALMNDMQKSRQASKQVPGQPLRPPIAPPLWNEQDKKDAHDLGIDLGGL